MAPAYEPFFGLAERPFSLTPEPRFFFKSQSHGRAIETLTFGLRAHERFLLVSGDLGVGKTMLCRTLIEQLRRRGGVSYVANPLLTAPALQRLLTEDLDVAPGGLKQPGVVIVDQAHTMPVQIVEHLLALAALEFNGQHMLQFVLVGQAPPGEPHRLGIREIDDSARTKVRLLPFAREECAAYVLHRVTIAGGHTALFSRRALDLVFAMSGGVPRLVNLLCERALQEAATVGATTIEPTTIDLAASALQLLRARPRRFRWFSRRVS